MEGEIWGGDNLERTICRGQSVGNNMEGQSGWSNVEGTIWRGPSVGGNMEGTIWNREQ